MKINIGAAVFIVLALTSATWGRNLLWQNEFTLCNDVIRKSPLKPRGHNNLGLVYETMGEAAAAMAAYSRAVAADPGYVPARNNRGLLSARLGRLKEAELDFFAVLQLQPGFAEKRFRTGIEPTSEAQAERIASAFARFNLGLQYRDQGRTVQAAEHFIAALRFAPDYLDAHLNLGIAFGEQGRLDMAIIHLERAALIDPRDPMVHHNLAYALKIAGRTAESEVHREQALILSR